MKNPLWQLKYLDATETKLVNQQPYSNIYDDVYYNDLGGIAESKYVFIEQNHLIERWKNNANQPAFCIGETGFGTGLNLLVTLQAWECTEVKPKKLHFISCEKYPLNFNDMKLGHANFPELNIYSQKLLSHWKLFNDVFRAGFHTIQISKEVTLTLAFGDATDSLYQLNATIDAWYLDGFSPRKNPDMWQLELFKQVAYLSRKGTTLSTFTAASQVSKTLKNVGFDVVKKPGFGKKREMITASFQADQVDSDSEHMWYPTPKAKTSNESITIIGGGIAGMCLAYYFKQANYHVTVIDQNPSPMQEASGHDMAMVMPFLTAQHSPESVFYLRAFETALNFYQSNEINCIGVQQNLHKAKHKKWAKTIQQLGLPGSLLHIPDHNNALYPSAGYVNNALVAKRLSSHVDQWLTTEVSQIDFNKSGEWQLFNHHGKLVKQTETLIIANGIKAQQLLNCYDLPLTAKHGMTTTVKPLNNQTLSNIQLANGYVIPSHDNSHWLCGATFDHLDTQQSYQAAKLHDDHWEKNLKLWQGLPLFQQLSQTQVIDAHAAIRATTPDHLPLCGPLIDQTKFKLDYHDLHHGRHWQSYPPAKPMSNLYIMNGLGSRGFTSAPLLAKYLCAMINGDPLPLEIDLCKIIHPNRFLYRSLKKAV